MVILKGYVRDGQASTEYDESMVISSAIIQGSRIVYTSSNGTFYTSADTATNYVTCEAAGYKTVEYSIPVFATTYDPSGVISGSVTSIDTSSHVGITTIWDVHKIFMSGSLTDRILTMMDGIDDGLTAIIMENDNNSIDLGSASGGITTTWTCMTSGAEWEPRELPVVVTLSDESIVLMGGYIEGEGKSNDVWRSTDNGSTWIEQTAAAAWTARTQFAGVVLSGDNIIIAGGFGAASADVWHSTDAGVNWHQQTTSGTMWTRRYGHAIVSLSDESIVLMAGEENASPYNYTNDVWRSTTQGVTWTQQTASAGWSARRNPSVVSMPDGSIVIMGGGIRSSPYCTNDVWRSTDNGATWTCMTSGAVWSPRQYFSSVCLSDGSIVIMGGLNSLTSIPTNDVWKSTDSGATWTQLTDDTWSIRSALGSTTLSGDIVVVVGGRNPDTDVWYNDVWKYAPLGASGNCVITSAVPGDIYNIGGVSGDPTNHIEFTMWANSAYGSRGQGE